MDTNMPADVEHTFITHSPEETLALGRRLGRALQAGDVVALAGPLGAGKTHLVKGIAEGLGLADSRDVTSPTFVLVNEYEARLPVYHFDAYRLTGADQLLEIGCEEYFAGQGVSLVEWADRVTAALPPDHLWIDIKPTGPTDRRLHLQAAGGFPLGPGMTADGTDNAAAGEGNETADERR